MSVRKEIRGYGAVAVVACAGLAGCGADDAKSPVNVAATGGADAKGGSAGTSAGKDSGTAGGAGDVGTGGGNPSNLPHIVNACPAKNDNPNAAMGPWEDATPPGVSLDAGFATGAGANFGTNAFVINPQDTAELYLGTSGQGIWKSNDCGATWTHINTGRNGDLLDKGRQWTMVIDAVDPKILYTNSGYGTSGVFKTTNGGVDWDQVLSKEATAAMVQGGFVERIDMDPTNHLHVLVSPHFSCEGSHAPSCLVETKDGGVTWQILDGAPPFLEASGHLMLDSKVWLVAETFGGLWRTADAGASWTRATDAESYAFPSIYHAPDGSYYMPAAFSVIRSPDGEKWSNIDGSPGAFTITGSKTHIYVGAGYCVVKGDPDKRFHMASVDAPDTWTLIDSPPTPFSAGYLLYDEDHHFLYASSCLGGFTRASMP